MLLSRRLYAIHPLLFAAYPVLFLFAQNAKEMSLRDVFLPLIVVLAATMVTVGVLALILRDLCKGAFVTSVGVLLFFSFGHVVSIIPVFSVTLGESQIGRTAVVMAAWGFIILGGLWLTSKTRKNLAGLTRALSVIGMVLVAVQIAQGGYVVLSRWRSLPPREITFSLGEVPEHRPDVYYIIMDAFSRADILKEIYQYDNSPFLDALRGRGFFVADSSYANYPVTAHSLTSSLNMKYIPDIADFDIESDDYVPMTAWLKNNEVFNLFRQLGYSIVAFSSCYAHTELKDADLYVTESVMRNEFVSILLAGTPIAVFQTTEENPYGKHRRHILNTLEKIPDVYEVRSPKLVFAHLVSPHPPFVFGPNGESVQPDWNFSLNDGNHLTRAGGTYEEYISGYRDQVTYISRCLLNTIDDLLSDDVNDNPIVILQADHGPRSALIKKPKTPSMRLRERYAILNAYYFPGVETDLLNPRITPVNSFRVVFDSYFGTSFGLLPDRIYNPTPSRPFDFTDITEKLDQP